MNCFHERLGELVVSNTPSDFEAFLKQAKKLCAKGTTLAFGFEDTTSFGRSLVKFLVEHKQLVKHVNSNLVTAERNAMNTLAKTDSIDAECACRVLINRFDSLPNANPKDKYWLMTKLVNRRDSLMKNNSTLKNQLHSAVADVYPNYKKIFKLILSNSSLAFYERYPSPKHLLDSSVDELAQLLSSASKKRLKDKKAYDIWAVVLADGVKESQHQSSHDFIVKSTVRQLRNNLLEIEETTKQMEELLTHFDYQLQSMNGISTVLAASLIAEIGDIRRFKTPASLATYSAVAPVTYASGESGVQYANSKGNRRLNETFFQLALTQVIPIGPSKKLLNPVMREYYLKKQADGKTKRQALKLVQRRLVNIIWRMMTDKVPYINPEPSYVG